MSGLSFMLGPTIGGILFDGFGFQGPFWGGAALSGLTLLMLVRYFPRRQSAFAAYHHHDALAEKLLDDRHEGIEGDLSLPTPPPPAMRQSSCFPCGYFLVLTH